MTEPTMVTDAEAAHWAHWAKQDAPDEYPLWRERASRLLADRERLFAALEDEHPLSLYREKAGTIGECLACQVQEEAGRGG